MSWQSKRKAPKQEEGGIRWRLVAVVAAGIAAVVLVPAAQKRGEEQRAETKAAADELNDWMSKKGVVVGLTELDKKCARATIPGRELSEAAARALGAGGDGEVPEDWDIARHSDRVQAAVIGGRAGQDAVRLAVGGTGVPVEIAVSVCARGERSFTVDMPLTVSDDARLLVAPAQPL